MNYNYSALVNPRSCAHCGNSFNPSQKNQRFCAPSCKLKFYNQKPHNHAPDRNQNTERQSPVRKCVSCLYRVGFGCKRIGRFVATPHNLVIRWVKQAGIFRDTSASLKSITATCGSESNRIARIQKRAFENEQKEFKSGDEGAHWSNHPVLKAWNAISKYYQNHERNKARSRQNAKRTWEKNRNNPEFRKKKLDAFRRYASENRDQIRRDKREWLKREKAKNPEKFREYARKARKQPKARAAHNIRRRIQQMISGKIGMRFNELVGCNRAQLMDWLQSKFKPGMAWNNYGTKWHVDHKTPLARFNLEDREQRKLASHYTNLQPLWAEENLAKSDSIVPHQPELAIPLAA